jgi:hypothetical protein
MPGRSYISALSSLRYCESPEVRKSCHGVTFQKRAISTLKALTLSTPRVDENTIFCFQTFQAIGDRSNHSWLSPSCKFWWPSILEDSLYSFTYTPLIPEVRFLYFSSDLLQDVTAPSFVSCFPTYAVKSVWNIAQVSLWKPHPEIWEICICVCICVCGCLFICLLVLLVTVL